MVAGKDGKKIASLFCTVCNHKWITEGVPMWPTPCPDCGAQFATLIPMIIEMPSKLDAVGEKARD